MAFTGTLDKCKACDKTVYVMDMLTLEGMPYHKSCFRCSHCNGTLVISNYSSMDGVLYCKPHFEQLFKESGNFSKNFQASGKTDKPNDAPPTRAPNRLSSFFSGTQDKCAACQKTVYPLEKMTLEGESYHKTCFRCAHSGCSLTHSSYAALNGVLYCKAHFSQLFLEKGSYNHVLQSANHRRTASSSSTPPEPADHDHDPDHDQNKPTAGDGGEDAGESPSATKTEEQDPTAGES
ncbi:PREDICTED: LIM domain-containing protein PLIM2c-like isoform X2 [Tarenaya hassleriana]|uniref:LIM domain-containing protein PLIM2c-like isoform X2 n=1 Tax=Tarenaya hassleriana TaxID=28532 RepID=UPI00053C6D4A|nr:PREDICTED: LIM domain-containing protein PLIM2c-like isoform X2 [Tarenaya hassleriana]